MSWPGRRLLVNFVTAVDGPGRGMLRPSRSEQAFQPPTDIYETTEGIVVRMEIAGMSAEEIGISVDESAGRLTITGVREDPAREEPKRYFNVEIECGEFMRVVQLARPVSVEEAAASYESGFLVVRLPFRSEPGGEPRNVPIE